MQVWVSLDMLEIQWMLLVSIIEKIATFKEVKTVRSSANINAKKWIALFNISYGILKIPKHPSISLDDVTSNGLNFGSKVINFNTPVAVI